ncbi:hypothetical protein WA026_005081 [Henosepilachna vigintioctopunctata]|uniref:Uncharacterized protein n=1 Tax=Henosepilachna vigintioctopunctata TaxID=420089 RepID=A0AAW1USI5_9CUCU
MIFNRPESGDPVLNTRIKHDKYSIANILTPANLSDNEVVRVLRMGKRGVKNRPAKVVFSTPEASKRVLRSRSVILENCKQKISINADQTPSQRTYLSDVRNRLDQRRQAGEDDLALKFINGKPTIISNNQKN